MTVPTVSCTNCGKNFTTDDLRGTNCRYCGTVLAHHARAAQQVAVINQMMVDRNGNGIPDAFEGLAQNAQANAMNQAFGYPHAPPAGGFGAPPPVAMHAMHVANVHAQQVTQTMSKVVVGIIIAVTLLTVVLVVGGIALTLLLR